MARMWHASYGQHLSGQRCRTFWMQTTGTTLTAGQTVQRSACVDACRGQP